MNARNGSKRRSGLSWWASLLPAALLMVSLSGCGPMSKESPKGFRLPQGDITRGKAAIVELSCATCHVVDGITGLPEPTADAALRVQLGGHITKLKTYGMLVTSIINPNHGIIHNGRHDYVDAAGNSLMPNLNNIITVQQLIDVVEFLQSTYHIDLPDYPSYYGPYLYPEPIPVQQ